MHEPTLCRCPITNWTVQAVPHGEPFEVGGKWFVWVSCPACDWDGRVRSAPGYTPAHPGPHIIPLTPTTPPPEWTSRYQEASA